MLGSNFLTIGKMKIAHMKNATDMPNELPSTNAPKKYVSLTSPIKTIIELNEHIY